MLEVNDHGGGVNSVISTKKYLLSESLVHVYW